MWFCWAIIFYAYSVHSDIHNVYFLICCCCIQCIMLLNGNITRCNMKMIKHNNVLLLPRLRVNKHQVQAQILMNISNDNSNLCIFCDIYGKKNCIYVVQLLLWFEINSKPFENFIIYVEIRLQIYFFCLCYLFSLFAISKKNIEINSFIKQWWVYTAKCDV